MIISEDVFSLSILVVIGAGMLVYYIYQKLNEISSVSLEGFKSKYQIITYFKESKKLILKKKWLLLGPLMIYLLEYLINSIFFIYNIIFQYGIDFLFNMRTINSAEKARSIFKFKNIFGYINDLVSRPINFNFLYYGRLINNIFFIFGALLFVILFKVVIKKIKKYITREDEEKMNFLRMILKYTLVFGLVILGFRLFLMNARNGMSSISESTRYFLGLGLIMNVSSIILFSFLQGFILFEIREGGKELDGLDLRIKKSLGSFGHLFKFNLILFLILNMRMTMYFIPLLGNIIFNSLPWLKYVFTLINLIIVLLTMFTPHIIIFEDKNVVKALKGSIEFITFNFSRYISLIIVLTIIEFVFRSLLGSINGSIYGYMYSHVLNGIFGFINIVFRVIFPIILTKFYFDYKGYEKRI
ncbi:hypothetical protein [Orenia marismortui]|uniref:Uncharacterized protein n=1 Tax=Orenia marismortui TaxID=46469 RepID=A0A4R8GFX2_9FIRM|nr:hypothetical protein [Orenia marismortui]TDX44402.1 hypothetical protein C7959_1556 [Orenia marismortui]